MRIEQTLRRLDGVVSATSEVQTGIIATTWSPTARLDLARLKSRFYTWRGAVRYGGATAVVTGALRRDDAGWLLEATGTGQRFRLASPPASDHPARVAWDSLAALAANPAARLRVTGEVEEGKGGELRLTLASVEALPR